jgi:hypothetical protein
VAVDRVVVAAALAPARQVAGVGELADDAVSCTFRDPDSLADVAQPNARVVRDAQEHEGVIAEE